ncbi:hypothetical protein ABK040_008487 [Willaertia magna]
MEQERIDNHPQLLLIDNNSKNVSLNNIDSSFNTKNNIFFGLPKSREEFMQLVCRIAKEDVKKCLAGIPVTHPNLLEQVKQLFPSSFPSSKSLPSSTTSSPKSKEKISSSTTQPTSVSKQNNNECNIKPPTESKPSKSIYSKQPSLIKGITKQETKKSVINSISSKKSIPPTSLKSKSNNNSVINDKLKTTNPSKESKEITQNAPRNKSSPNNVYERLLKPTVAIQKKFEKEVVNKVKEKEFTELRKEQKKATSLLLNRNSPKKKKIIKENISAHSSPNEESSVLSTPQPQLDKIPTREGSPRLNEYNISKEEKEIQTTIEIPPRFEGGNPNNNVPKTNNIQPKTLATNVNNENNPIERSLYNKRANNVNYKQLEDQILNDLLFELAEEEMKNKQKRKTHVVKKNILQEIRKPFKHNEVEEGQLEKILSLLTEMEKKENQIRQRYCEIKQGVIPVNASISSFISTTSDTLSSDSVIRSSMSSSTSEFPLDYNTTKEIRKNREKYEQFIHNSFDISPKVLETLSEDILNEVMGEVYNEFSKATNDIVGQIAASEFGYDEMDSLPNLSGTLSSTTTDSTINL